MPVSELLQHPERYQIGSYRSFHNKVFPVYFEGEHYVIKKQRLTSSIARAYTGWQDKIFLNGRPTICLENEARALQILQGCRAPKIIDFQDNILVREYLKGRDFRFLRFESEQERSLEDGLEALKGIHDKGLIVGDANLKNLLLGENNCTYWLDFEAAGTFSDESRAADVLKFIYSAYTITRNEELTLYAARLFAHQYNFPAVGELLQHMPSGHKLWFATRISRNSLLPEQIRHTLS